MVIDDAAPDNRGGSAAIRARAEAFEKVAAEYRIRPVELLSLDITELAGRIIKVTGWKINRDRATLVSLQVWLAEYIAGLDD